LTLIPAFAMILDNMNTEIVNAVAQLQRGHVIELFGTEHVVVMANDCRARVVPLGRKRVDYKTRFGKSVEFETSGTSYNISPNSLVPVIRRMTEPQLLEANFKAAKIITVGGEEII